MTETTEEQQEDPNSKSPKVARHLISVVLTTFLIWAVYDATVRNIVFLVYLVMMSAMVIFGLIAFKEMKIGGWQILNISLQIIIIGTLIYGLIEPEHASKIAVLLLGLHLFQSIQAYLTKYFKTERRTDERKGAMHR